MRIGITCYPSAGGSGVIATELGHALARNGHEIHFVSYSRPFRLDRKGEGTTFHKVKTVTYPLFKYPPYSLALAVRMAEVVRHGEDGMLAPLGDLERMIEMTLELLQTNGLRERMGESARKRATETFPTEKVVAVYENLYRRVLAEGSQGE